MKTLAIQPGFGAFEVIAILIIVALLGVMAVPRMGVESQDTDTSGPERSAGLVKSAHASAIADLKRYPTVAELNKYIEEDRATPSGSGIRLSVKGAGYAVPTFSDAACRQPTRTIDDPVACIGTL